MSIQKAQNVLKQNAAYVCIYKEKGKKKNIDFALSLSLSRANIPIYLDSHTHTDRHIWPASRVLRAPIQTGVSLNGLLIVKQ